MISLTPINNVQVALPPVANPPAEMTYSAMANRSADFLHYDFEHQLPSREVQADGKHVLYLDLEHQLSTNEVHVIFYLILHCVQLPFNKKVKSIP